MTISEIYNAVLKKTEAQIKLLKIEHVDFNDVVNDAFIRVKEEKQQVNINTLYKAVNNLLMEYKHAKQLDKQLYIGQRSANCGKCATQKPVSEFGITTRKKFKKQYIQFYCHECQAEIMSDYRKTQKGKAADRSAKLKYYSTTKGAEARKRASKKQTETTDRRSYYKQWYEKKKLRSQAARQGNTGL